MERRNNPIKPSWIANVAVPGGGQNFFLDEEEAAAYNNDPDGYAAKLVGLTKMEYLQWVDLDGAALCAHRTKGGDLCRNNVGGFQLKAKEWKARHRKWTCATHGGKPRQRP
jgi:hypothetical protein